MRRVSTEEPTVVDFALQRNTLGGSAVAVANTSNSYRAEEENYYVTTRTKPFILGMGETKSILNFKEEGEIVSIDIIVDNAFAQVYLQLDDYKANEQGVTAAELLKIGRTEFAEGEFSAKKLPSGEYLLTYAPRRTIKYSDQIKLAISNRIPRLSAQQNSIGSEFDTATNFRMRGGVIQVSKLPFLGGSVLDLPHLAGETNEQRITAATARNVAWETYENKENNQNTVDGARIEGFKQNLNVLVGDESTTSDLNPYEGRIGRFELHAEVPSIHYGRVVFFPKGTAASATTGAPLADDDFQHVMLFAASSISSSAEDETANFLGAVLVDVGKTYFVRDGGKFYFPGTIESVFKYNSVTAHFEVGLLGDGAVILRISPGLDFVPDKVPLLSVAAGEPTLTNHGIIIHTGTGKQYDHSGITVREVIVKRKKRRSLV